jgi:hypothetical protein
MVDAKHHHHHQCTQRASGQLLQRCNRLRATPFDRRKQEEAQVTMLAVSLTSFLLPRSVGDRPAVASCSRCVLKSQNAVMIHEPSLAANGHLAKNTILVSRLRASLVRARLLACKIGAVGCNTDASLSRAMNTSCLHDRVPQNGQTCKVQKHAQ